MSLREALTKVVPDMPLPWYDDTNPDWTDTIDFLVAAPAFLPDESWCDCDYEPVRGIKAGRHLPSCRYGIVLDYLDIADPRVTHTPSTDLPTQETAP